MKGIVFTEFLEMVEDKFSFVTVNNIIEKSDLKSNGVYTSIGTYSHLELISLVTALSKEIKIPTSEIMKVYGQYLFGKFREAYPVFFKHVKDPFTFLESIHSHIHKEILKLYPDVVLPSFVTERVQDKHLRMHYQSERSMGDFAHGLILGCLKHFQQDGEVIVSPNNELKTEVTFDIILN